MDSAGGTSAAVVEEVEEVMGAPRAAKRRRVAEAPWRGGQVGREACLLRLRGRPAVIIFIAFGFVSEGSLMKRYVF
jgi:hypothetical protein